MSFNLVDFVTESLGGDIAKTLAGSLGASQDNVSGGLQAMIPSVLGMMLNKGADEKGAGALLDFASKQNLDSLLSGNIADLVSGGAKTEEITKVGSGILDFLGGDNFDISKVIGAISGVSGLGEKTGGGLLKLISPFIMSSVASYAKSKSLGALGLANLFGGQAKNIASALPAGLGSQLGFADLGAGAAKVSAAAGSTAKASAAAVSSAGSKESGGLGWLVPALGVLALLWGLLYLFTGSEEGDKMMAKTGDLGAGLKGSLESAGEGLGSVAGAVGGVAGSVGEMAGKVGEMAGDAAGGAAGLVGDAAGKVGDMAGKAGDMAAKAGEMAGKAGEMVKDAGGAVVDGAEGVAGAAGEMAKGAVDMAGDAAGAAGDMAKGAAGMAGDMAKGAAEMAGDAAGMAKDAGAAVAGGVGAVAGAAGDTAAAMADKVKLAKYSLPTGENIEIAEGSFTSKFAEYLSSAPAGEVKSFDFDQVNFQTGSANLTDTSMRQVNNLAAILKAYPNVNIEIQGHTDNTGNAAANKTLSQSRANSVRQTLVGKGIDAGRVTAVGYGQESPIASNDTDEGRAQNRRVSVAVTSRG